jgi:cytochrome d ubiquinol oxidase subunit II
VGVAVVFLAASWWATDLYANYLHHPALFLVILVTVAALLAARVFMARQAWFKAWAASAVTIRGRHFLRGDRSLSPLCFPPAWMPRST